MTHGLLSIVFIIALEIIEDGKRISEGYSPFTAEKYSIDQSPNVPTPADKTKDSGS